MAQVVAVIASTHHPFYYRASTAVGEERPPFADEWVAKIERFRETLTRARPDVLVMVGSDHFHQLWLDNMPQFLVGKAPVYDANWYNEEREFGLPQVPARRPRGALVAHPARWPGLRVRPRLQQRAADRPLDHLPDHHAATRGRPADRADLHQHLRAAAAAAEAVRRAGPRHPRARRVVAERPAGRHHRHRAPLARARRPAPVRPARPRPGVRPAGGAVDRERRPRRVPARGEPGQPAPARQRHPRLHGLHADDGRGRARTRRPTTSTASTCSTRWRPTSPGTRTERRHEQVPR